MTGRTSDQAADQTNQPMNETRNSRPQWLVRLVSVLQRINPLYAGAAILAVVVMSALLVVWLKPQPLPDFDVFEEVATRKKAFFGYLAPLVETENRRIAQQRERLVELVAGLEEGRSPGWFDRRWLVRLANEYDVDWDARDPADSMAMLKKRVDTVPVTLALVQAATESAWGRSRFALEGNNLFGQWCYQTGCGIVPSQRSAGQAHEVAAFSSVRESVARYIHNLNTHPAYQPLRDIRARLRAADKQPTAMALADGLLRYSERRGEYVEEVKTVIRLNRPIIEEILE